MKTHKILISSGFGAGFSSWMHNKDAKRFALTYLPIITALESDTDDQSLSEYHPAVISFKAEFFDRFNSDPYLGGLHQLCVVEVDGPFVIREYDGSESVQMRYETDWIDLDLEN